jgi:hypothetical protein
VSQALKVWKGPLGVGNLVPFNVTDVDLVGAWVNEERGVSGTIPAPSWNNIFIVSTLCHLSKVYWPVPAHGTPILSTYQYGFVTEGASLQSTCGNFLKSASL